MHLENYDSQATSWKGSIWMFVAGTAIGAAAALMIAPASGRESREYLRKQGRKVADDVSTQADRLASAIRWGQEHATATVRETMETAMSQAKAAYNAARSHREGESIPSRMGETTSATANTPRPAPSPRPMNSSS